MPSDHARQDIAEPAYS